MNKSTREDQIAALYASHADTIEHFVGKRVSADPDLIEDACQTAWMRLYMHTEVEIDTRGTIRWLLVTATREARSLIGRSVPSGSMTAGVEGLAEGELPEPTATGDDPLEIAIRQEEMADRRERLSKLTDRERRYLALQALGLSHKEMAEITGDSLRTVERVVLRGRGKLKGGGK